MKHNSSVIACSNCQAEIQLPNYGQALLDEFGNAHIRCQVCGIELVVPYPMQSYSEGSSMWKRVGDAHRNGNLSILIIIILAAIALALTMLPVTNNQPERQQTPQFSPEEYVYVPLERVSMAFCKIGSDSGVVCPTTSTSGTRGFPSKRMPFIVT